jgi:dihydroorotate dehydrogenase
VVQIYTGLIYRGPGLVKESAMAIQRVSRANAHTKP